MSKYYKSLHSFSKAKTFAGRAKLDRRLWVKTAVHTYLFTFFSGSHVHVQYLHSVEILVSYPLV